jgi:prolycopene isomerase
MSALLAFIDIPMAGCYSSLCRGGNKAGKGLSAFPASNNDIDGRRQPVFVFQKGEMMSREASDRNYDVIVIGAGMGGLTAASLLAEAGKKVLLAEKEPRPGGYIGALVHGSFQFDTAARLIMGCTADSPCGPGPVFTLLDRLGLQNKCEFIKVQPFCTMRLPELSFEMWSGRQAFIDGLRRKFQTGLEELSGLLDLCNKIYRGVMAFSTLKSNWGLLKIPFQYPALIRYRNATVEEVLARFIPEERPRTAVASLWPYIGLLPERASFLMWATMMASYIEEGAFFCKGGLHRLADVVAGSFVADGGELALECAVTKIFVTDRTVRGVRLANGQEVFAPVVLCAEDCRHAFSELLEPAQLPDRYRTGVGRLEPSIQAVDVSLVTDLDLPALGFGFETLVFDSWNMQEVWDATFSGNVGIFTLTVTTAVDPSLAPTGYHLVSSACGLPGDLKPSPEDTRSRGARLFGEIKKNVPGLADHLALARLGGPPEGYIVQRFGPIYGWAATPRQIGMGRLGPRTPIRGLHLVGHWTQPGHGVLTAVLSGLNAAQRLLK